MLTSCLKSRRLLIFISCCISVSTIAQPQDVVPPIMPSQGGLVDSVQEELIAQPTVIEELTHHSLRILLDPENLTISVEDTIRFPANIQPNNLQFGLNANLTITNNSGSLSPLSSQSDSSAIGINSLGADGAKANQYSLRLSRRSDRQASLIYSGSIYQLAQQSSTEYAQSFSESSGIISSDGVYLNKASAWIPDFGEDRITFDMQVEFVDSASSWTAVSQGDRAGENGWRSDQPMEEVYLIAANFTEYSAQAGGTEVLAYLRTPDTNLANKYLEATDRYLSLYEPLLGDYAYSKFALIENFWETGYGMPSFTLLGEQVIRFPFILESSYPHEILHNWWGNGVYPDYDSGNWSEGLTAYLADHLFREMEGSGAEYRKEMLSRYKNYVAQDADFPLANFTSRNSAATQAVGYGKTLMLWHMLRIEIGNELFLTGLRKLYQDYKFQRASFSDIAALYTEVAGMDLQPFFNQWVNRVGAPELSISVEEIDDNQARIMFVQIQEDDPFTITVPVALFYEGEEYPQVYDIALGQKLDGVVADNYAGLNAVLVDPYFDVFRQLDREETPPTIGELFGATELTFILPPTDQEQWRIMAEAFSAGTNSTIVSADEVEQLPDGQSVWILGKNNPFANLMSDQIEPYSAELRTDSVVLARREIEDINRSTVIIGRHPNNSELALGLIHIDDMVAMEGMIEKLPHYGKYSYLSFLGTEPTNDVKGVWESNASPMRWLKPESSAVIAWDKLPVVPAIAELPARYPPNKLLSHVTALTTSEMAGRAVGSAGIDLAATYIATQFSEAGLQSVDGSYYQQWNETLNDNTRVRLRNVVGMIPGSNPNLSKHPVVIGAHYDHLGLDNVSGMPFAGADDNGSGIAVLIEVASQLSSGFSPQRPILFVAFSGEENGLLGSKRFVEFPAGGYSSENIFAMINLDSVGRLEGRQLQVFGTDSAYEWPFMAQGIGFTIGLQASFPDQTIASSDHVNFLNAGIPAIHLFSGVTADYHQVSDTAEKLDAEGLSQVALWLEEATVYLADNENPLRVTLGGAPVVVQTSAGAREASLGTVPDFAFSGVGVRISAATPGGAAAQAGLLAGDILLSFQGTPITNLQTYSNLIRESSPGDSVMLEVRREQEILNVEVQLKAR